MIAQSKILKLVLVPLFYSVMLANCVFAAETPPQSGPGEQLQNSVRQYIEATAVYKNAQYRVSFYDLADNGSLEAIVYVDEAKLCGSSGCETFILAPEQNSWTTIGKIAATWPPIRVLSNKSHGWHSLGVWVQGEGAQSGYEAELPFSGTSYPNNAKILPAKPAASGTSGEVIFSNKL